MRKKGEIRIQPVPSRRETVNADKVPGHDLLPQTMIAGKRKHPLEYKVHGG